MWINCGSMDNFGSVSAGELSDGYVITYIGDDDFFCYESSGAGD